MAFVFREVEQKEVWDEFVLTAAPGALFQTWDWGEVINKTGSPLWRIGAFDGTRIVGAMQITRVDARRGSFLHVRHGPVFASSSPSFMREATVFLSQHARKEGVWFVRVSPQIAATPEHDDLLRQLSYRPAPIHAMDAEQCWVLDLSATEEELLSHMRKTTRYEIRQAQKLGVNVKVSKDAKDVSAFLGLYGKTATRHGFIPHKGLKEEFLVFNKQNKAQLFLGYYEGALVSGAIVLFVGSQAIYHHGASILSKAPVSALVQWSAIVEAKKRGMKVYNFWGIAPEDKKNHPWRGITLFKKGFGGREVNFLHAQDLPVSPLYFVSFLVEYVRRLVRGY
jgi:lipid II:glycine glycyltransferase (peptidoglycan interpeptide bridge formation enzyme)